MTQHSLTQTCQALSELLLVAACICGCVEPAAASDPPVASRVRDNGDPAIAALIHTARERSATFRRLNEAIDATDGVVYVEQGKCRPGVQACLLMTVMVSGSNRLLKVHINIQRDQAAVIGSLGHELQHALEVLSESGVRTDALMYGFFDRLAGSPAARLGMLEFETEAALRTGEHVRAEVEAAQRAGR